MTYEEIVDELVYGGVIRCHYCLELPALTRGSKIYPHRPDLAHLWFWECSDCNAFTGCHVQSSYHPNHTTPLGTLGRPTLRLARSAAHRVFDPLWKGRGKIFNSRGSAYSWLARELDLLESHCHIGYFSEEMCAKVQILCSGK